jgi:D-tyrosyl-tRNA(Tyr) deacylase
MRIVVQRVNQASVIVNEKTIGEIRKGLLVFAGFEASDRDGDYDYIMNKIIGLRVFEDQEGKMNLSVSDIFGGILVVPNFTLYGDVRKGFRPSFTGSSPVEEAREQFRGFQKLFSERFPLVEYGEFQADMEVRAVNDGPITIMLDSKRLF